MSAEQRRVYPLSVELPPGWRDHTVYSFVGPYHGGAAPSLQLTVHPLDGALDVHAFAKHAIDAAVRHLPDVEILGQGAHRLPSGQAAYQCTYRWQPSAGQTSHHRHIYLVSDRVGFVFAARLAQHASNDAAETIDRIADSVRPASSGAAGHNASTSE